MTRQSSTIPALLAFVAISFAPSSHAETAQLIEGATDSRVRVVIYEDLACPDCAVFLRILPEFLLRYGDRVAFVHKDFPLVRHVWARRAAIASRFFAEQSVSLGLAFRREVAQQQGSLRLENFDRFVERFAREKGIDPAAARSSLTDAKYEGLVQADCVEGVKQGILHTPTVLVGQRRFIEHVSIEDMRKALDDLLEAGPGRVRQSGLDGKQR